MVCSPRMDFGRNWGDGLFRFFTRRVKRKYEIVRFSRVNNQGNSFATTRSTPKPSHNLELFARKVVLTSGSSRDCNACVNDASGFVTTNAAPSSASALR